MTLNDRNKLSLITPPEPIEGESEPDLANMHCGLKKGAANGCPHAQVRHRAAPHSNRGQGS